jgi:hypothetical protein
MNRSQKAMVAKIMNAKQGQYKKHQLIKTFAIAASGLSYDQSYEALIAITVKMTALMGQAVKITSITVEEEIPVDVDGLVGLIGAKGETGAEVLTSEIQPPVDGLTGIQGETGIQGSKVDTRTPAQKRKDTIARKKLAELAAAKDEAPEDVLNELDKQFG